MKPYKTLKPEFYYQFTSNRLVDGGVAYRAGCPAAATAFVRMEGDGDWRVSIARCSWGDQFCRRTGRNVARRRYFLDKNKATKFDHKPTYEEALALV